MTTAAAALPAHQDLTDIPRDRYTRLLARLSHLSVTHHFDAYGESVGTHPNSRLIPPIHGGNCRPTRRSARQSGTRPCRKESGSASGWIAPRQ